MTFSEQLNQYIALLSCSAKELSAACGLSDTVISRYRSGERVPGVHSAQLEKLCTGIAALANRQGIAGYPAETVRACFSEILAKEENSRAWLSANLNTLISVLELNTTELARFMNFDASYLSRIRSGQRRPADPENFAMQVAGFVEKRYGSPEKRAAVAELLGVEAGRLASDSACRALLAEWLCSEPDSTQESMEEFLEKLDDFDLDEYIRAIRFDQLKVPTLLFQLPASKQYYGLEEMKQGELDFFKATVLSKSADPVFMCSDMPMADMAEDVAFGKKWMFAIAMMLKKGLHLNIIHNIDRPFREMMLGLESWIPIYMTGQVSPYFLKGIQNSVYCHLNYVSGHAALCGECLEGCHASGKYYLTNNRDEVAYYQRKAADLLQKAQPLMEIYRSSEENAYHAFLHSDALTAGKRHGVLSSLPIYTISEPLLRKILTENGVPEADRARLLAYAGEQRKQVETLLENSELLDEVAEVPLEEFSQYPMVLSLSGAFYEKEIFYSYADYFEHLRQTDAFAEQHPRYCVQKNRHHAFRNIQIVIHEGKWVMISKNKAPAIHFIIRHSKMVGALQNFMAPVTDFAPLDFDLEDEEGLADGSDAEQLV